MKIYGRTDIKLHMVLTSAMDAGCQFEALEE